MSWLNSFSRLIKELSSISDAIKKIEQEMKYHGLTDLTVENSIKILNSLSTKKAKQFKNILISQIQLQSQTIQGKNPILFSSDILESIFGKYKNCTNNNPMASITSLILIMASFTCELTNENIVKSMEDVSIKDIKMWSEDNIGVSLFSERLSLLSA